MKITSIEMANGVFSARISNVTAEEMAVIARVGVIGSKEKQVKRAKGVRKTCELCKRGYNGGKASRFCSHRCAGKNSMAVRKARQA